MPVFFIYLIIYRYGDFYEFILFLFLLFVLGGRGRAFLFTYCVEPAFLIYLIRRGIFLLRAE